MHFYGSVVTLAPDDHRIFYACNVLGAKQGAVDDQSSCCVAVSTDGVTWTKPLLPFIPFNAAFPRTNMVFATGAGWFDSMLALPPGVPPPLGAPVTPSRLAGVCGKGATLMALDDPRAWQTEAVQKNPTQNVP